MAKTGKLAGCVALVTGGGGAIGGAICRLYASEGAQVLVADLRAEEAQAVANEIGDAARSFALDVADSAQGRAAVSYAVEVFGALHILVNVAAAVTP
ncbi:SDR family NAD(P)-dependent oxidoreductase, partial [Alphaproteobacteria bacterium]|nr:SDR family NAD(P)-dependent oxidoreductase [Alphaproteobacteria bacterium]